MAHLITLEANKTYATRENAIKAFEKKFGNNDSIRYIIIQHTDGRFYPAALGQDAMKFGAHFHFHVIG